MSRSFVLVAAFRPFGGRDRNESGKALCAFQARRVPSRSVRTVLLPVSWRRATPMLTPFLDDPALAAVVLFGEASKRRGVTVERWGRNRARRILDMEGANPPAERLAPRGASRRRATWDPLEVVRAVRSVGVPASESRDAGGYLCNAVLYKTLERLARRGLRVPATFVHLPVPGGGAAKGVTAGRLAKAFAAVVDEACRRFLPAAASTPARRARAPRRAPRRG